MNRILTFILVCCGFGAPCSFGQGNRTGSEVRPLRVYRIWTVFLHPRYGFVLPVPPGVRAVGEPEESSEPMFVSNDRSFIMSAWGGLSPEPPASMMEAQWRVAQRKGGRVITYQRRGSTWFVVSGTDTAGTEFYEKFLMRGDHVAGLTITFPHSRMNEFEGWVEKIEDGFRVVALRNGPPETTPTRDVSSSQPRTTSRLESDRPPPTKRTDETPTVKPAPKLTPEDEPTPAVKVAPYAQEVPGKSGFVYSPFDSQNRLVDVQGIPSGTKVKCPYTMKIFLVP